MGSALLIAIGAGRSSIRSPGRKIRTVEITRLKFFPVFCRVEDPIVRGRSAETAGFFDGRDESYGLKRLVEGMGPVGIDEDMFHEAVGGPWCMEREIT